ncbi:hypothetical protein RJ641_020323 [Dillenia turbinata]|uniref:B box-type domain-containing protein n=1 Tax=Dillenia turbinata TaxID=194707 RepID=A0AAN8UPU2_9MAGN
MKTRVCELCNGEAALYCSSDVAYLCCACDARVHGANFLVARHLRQVVCSKCKQINGAPISGAGFCDLRRLCSSCSPQSDEPDGSSSSSSLPSACVSTTDSSKNVVSYRRKEEKSTTSSEKKEKSVAVKAEGILVNWCRKLGVDGNSVVGLASHAFAVCASKFTGLPLRVALTASLWVGLKCGGYGRCENLKRVEEISGVPAKLVVAVESRLARVMMKMRKPRPDLEEGWAECS